VIRGVPVLMYHWVSDRPGERLRKYGVLPRDFARHMSFLSRRGWRCVTLAALRESLEERRPLPARSFVLTFDDGTDDLEPNVLPVLQRHGFTATSFVVTGCAGDVNRWDLRHGDPPRSLLGPETLRRLDGPTVRFESHSCTHQFLTALDAAAANREILDSKRWLEDLLGRQVEAFSYPHGLFNHPIEEMVREAGYLCAATDIRGLNRPGTGPFRVRRVMITAADGAAGFAFKLATGHDVRSAIRSLAGLETGAPAMGEGEAAAGRRARW